MFGQSDVAVDVPNVFGDILLASKYTHDFHYIFAIKRAKLKPPTFNVLYPLDSTTWFLIGMSFLGLALVMGMLIPRERDNLTVWVNFFT